MADNKQTEAAHAPMFAADLHDGVLLATLDMPGRTMNVFSWELMNQLEKLIDRVENDARVEALVLTSGKPTFLAGADLDMVRGFTERGRNASRAELRGTCGRLGRMFARLEELVKPTVAAINGLALGGGLEIAMACRWRIAADDPRLQLGLPEIRLGLLPGAGGTQRLPRLIGIGKGMELLLSGKSVAPAEALALGLIDETAPREALIARAIAAARKLVSVPVAPRTAGLLDLGPFSANAPDAIRVVTRYFGYADDAMLKYPAYDAIVRSTLGGAHLPVREGSEIEMERFVDLMHDDVAGNMVTILFLERQKADKLVLQFAGLKGARFTVAGEGREAEALRAALTAAKAMMVDPAQAGEADILIAAPNGGGPRVADLVALGSGDQLAPGQTGIFYARSRSYGGALEIAGAAAGRDRALALARALRATPWLHAGEASLLARLADVAARGAASGTDEAAIAAEQALAAGDFAAAHPLGDHAQADVACAVSGIFPAWAGGPFRHLARHGLTQLEAAAAVMQRLHRQKS